MTRPRERPRVESLNQAAQTRGEQEGLPDAVHKVQETFEVNLVRVLWVDDHPENNVYESVALQLLGASITVATDTSTAFKFLHSGLRFQLIITDIGRGSATTAGVDLIKELKKEGVEVPIIVYTSARHPHWDDAERAGATFVTSSPAKLTSGYLELAGGSRRGILGQFTRDNKSDAPRGPSTSGNWSLRILQQSKVTAPTSSSSGSSGRTGDRPRRQ